MASVDFYYLNGQTKHFGPGIRVSSYKARYYVWPAGPHVKGSKPIFSVAMSELHAVRRTGRKGINITKY